MTPTNPYCDALGIAVPRLETAARSPDANYFSLLLVALLERGEPITLEQAAARFGEAGIAPAAFALASLKRCQPGRPPIYRDGALYALDPHDAEADLWAFRLGLRPARGPRLTVVRPDPGPLPSVDEPLRVPALDEAWRDGIPNHWTSQRIAICVLDAHDAPMPADAVIGFVRERVGATRLERAAARYWRRGAPVRAREDGDWELDREHAAVRSAREAVRERVEIARRWAEQRPAASVLAAQRQHSERQRAARAEQLAQLRRALVLAFPAKHPEAVVLLDVESRTLTTHLGDQIAAVRERLAGYDMIAALDVRALLRSLAFDPGERRLAELGPPQKTLRLDRKGGTLKITTTLLIQGSCGIQRPFGDPARLRRYLDEGQTTKLRRRLEADAKSLFALYQYGRVHGTVRLRWEFLDERIPAPWVHRDEPTLWRLKDRAFERGLPLEIVTGSAPGWEDPWARAQRVHARKPPPDWRVWLVADDGSIVDEDDVQLARLVEPGNPGLVDHADRRDD